MSDKDQRKCRNFAFKCSSKEEDKVPTEVVALLDKSMLKSPTK